MTLEELQQELVARGWHEGAPGSSRRYVKVAAPNPKYNPAKRANDELNPENIERVVEVFVKDGKDVYSVLSIPQADGSLTYSQYDVTPKDTERTATQQASDALAAREQQEREANLRPVEDGGTGHYETNKDRDARIERDKVAAERAAASGRATSAESRAVEDQNLQRETAKRAADAANKPSVNLIVRNGQTFQVTTFPNDPENPHVKHLPNVPAEQQKSETISAPPNQKHILREKPDGSVVQIENPNYDSRKEDGEQLRQKLATAVSLGQMSEVAAKAQFDRWYTINVKIPNEISTELRSRAEELRKERDTEDRRQQFASTFQQNREVQGLQAGQNAVSNVISTLPYKAGPKFGEQFAAGVNALAKGTSEGVHFTADAFEYPAPNFDEIARQGTARALKQISPLARSMTEPRAPIETQYPSTPVMTTPPPAAPSVSWEKMLQDFLGTQGFDQTQEEVYP